MAESLGLTSRPGGSDAGRHDWGVAASKVIMFRAEGETTELGTGASESRRLLVAQEMKLRPDVRRFRKYISLLAVGRRVEK